jgi:hypothetical protein
VLRRVRLRFVVGLDNRPAGGYIARMRTFALLASAFLVSCGLLPAEAPSAGEALNTLKNACAIAQVARDLPSDAVKACKMVERLEIKEAE